MDNSQFREQLVGECAGLSRSFIPIVDACLKTKNSEPTPRTRTTIMEAESTVDLLSIRNRRQPSFDFAHLWPDTNTPAER